jgi:hypothetical protein
MRVNIFKAGMVRSESTDMQRKKSPCSKGRFHIKNSILTSIILKFPVFWDMTLCNFKKLSEVQLYSIKQ